MKLEDIKTIGVVGAGTMGQGIAQICAQAGFTTILFDINAQVLEKAKSTITQNLDKGIARGKLTEAERKTALDNLTFTGDTLQLSCQIIIEAVVERLEVKQSIFKELASMNPTDTILASNTSSIPITQIAASIPHPERVVGMHFFNPAHIMKLVEVISGAATAQETADVETIDKLMQASGFKMGPFELMDLIGVDTNYSVTTSMFEAFHYDSKFRPSRIQQQKVDAGHHGRKSGKGFYTYE